MPPFMPSQKSRSAKQRSKIGYQYTASLALIHARYRRVHQEALRIHGDPSDAEMPHETRMAFHAHVADAKQEFVDSERALRGEQMAKVARRPGRALRMRVTLK
jgi:hypothetical protein